MLTWDLFQVGNCYKDKSVPDIGCSESNPSKFSSDFDVKAFEESFFLVIVEVLVGGIHDNGDGLYPVSRIDNPLVRIIKGDFRWVGQFLSQDFGK